MATIDKFFKALKDQGGSDLHIQAGQPPKFRIHGRLEPLNMPPLSNEECEELLFEIRSCWPYAMIDEDAFRRVLFYLSDDDLGVLLEDFYRSHAGSRSSAPPAKGG